MGFLASAAVAVLGLAVVGGALETWLWPGPALAFFRPQLTLALALAALLALLADRHRAAVAGFAVAVAGAALLLPAARGRAEPPAPGTATVRLLALNLTYHHDDVEAVAELIRRERPDVITLSELTPEWNAGLSPALAPYAVRATEAHEGKDGIGLWGRELALREPQVVRLTEDARPSVQATLELPDGRRVPLLVVHAVSGLEYGELGAHRRSFDALGEWAAEHGPLAAVCGDLNAAPWSRSLRRTLGRGGLRTAIPGGPLWGSWPKLPRPLRVPIDGCLVGEDLRARAESAPDVGSDHLPVLIELGGVSGSSWGTEQGHSG